MFVTSFLQHEERGNEQGGPPNPLACHSAHGNSKILATLLTLTEIITTKYKYVGRIFHVLIQGVLSTKENIKEYILDVHINIPVCVEVGGEGV